MIRVISGTIGIYENNRMELKTPKSGPFELEGKREAELVAAGIAKYCDQASAPSQPPAPDKTPEPPVAGDGKDGNAEPGAAELPQYNEGMKLDELKEIAKAYGVDAAAMRSKAQVVAAIEAAKIAAAESSENENSDTDEDENELPDLNAADPV